MREYLHRPKRQEEPARRSENDNAMQENDLISRFPNGIFGDNNVDTPKQEDSFTTDKTETIESEKKSVNDLTTSEKGVDFIKSFEGKRLELYNDDAGYATIGYGHLVHYGKVGTNTEKEKEFKSGITDEKAIELLKQDVKDKGEKYVKSYVSVKLTQEQFDALVSFTFNVGSGNFKSSSLLKEVNKETATLETIKEKFMLWNKAGGKELSGLTKRREREAKIYNEGIYENN